MLFKVQMTQLFVDLEKAYDSVVRNELRKSLSTSGMNSRLIQALQIIYKH